MPFFLALVSLIWVEMKACLLIRTGPGKHNDVAESVAGMEGVKLAFPVLGRADGAANVEVGDLKALTELVLKLMGVEGVAASETLIGLEV
jgi:hypothetical protein